MIRFHTLPCRESLMFSIPSGNLLWYCIHGLMSSRSLDQEQAKHLQKMCHEQMQAKSVAHFSTHVSVQYQRTISLGNLEVDKLEKKIDTGKVLLQKTAICFPSKPNFTNSSTKQVNKVYPNVILHKEKKYSQNFDTPISTVELSQSKSIKQHTY